jgi:hypothetical protein
LLDTNTFEATFNGDFGVGSKGCSAAEQALDGRQVVVGNQGVFRQCDYDGRYYVGNGDLILPSAHNTKRKQMVKMVTFCCSQVFRNNSRSNFGIKAQRLPANLTQ